MLGSESFLPDAADRLTGKDVYNYARQHAGTKVLHRFLANLAVGELPKQKMKIFFASMTAFVRHITPGIPALGALGDCVDAIVAMAGKVVSKCHAPPRGVLQKRHLYHHARVAYSSMMPLSLFENDSRHAMIARRLPFGRIRKNGLWVAFANGNAIWNIYCRLKNGFHRSGEVPVLEWRSPKKISSRRCFPDRARRFPCDTWLPPP